MDRFPLCILAHNIREMWMIIPDPFFKGNFSFPFSPTSTTATTRSGQRHCLISPREKDTNYTALPRPASNKPAIIPQTPTVKMLMITNSTFLPCFIFFRNNDIHQNQPPELYRSLGQSVSPLPSSSRRSHNCVPRSPRSVREPASANTEREL